MRVLRWGRSAYESDADLALEREVIENLGGSLTLAATKERPNLKGVQVLVVTSKVKVTDEVLSRFEGDLVLTTTSGFDHIDVQAASAKGVQVARSPMARADAVVEHALGAMIALRRRLWPLQSQAQAGVWARGELPTLMPLGLAGATVGVVGCGVIGSKMGRVLLALGARPKVVDPRGVPAPFDQVTLDEAMRCDVVTLHCNLGPSSRGLVDSRALSLMGPETVLVNTARGDVLDYPAAIEAVREGQLGGLAVDVFPEEPWSNLGQDAAIPGVLLTPHASGYVRGLGRKVAKDVGFVLTRYVAGELPVSHRVLPTGA